MVALFLLESEMISHIERKAPALLGFKGSYAYANELPVNNRVVDFALAPIDARQLTLSREEAKALCKLSMVQLDVLSLFVGRPKVTLQYLSRTTFMPAPLLVRDFITVFSQYSLITRTSRYSYSATDWIEALPPYIVAIEAKLNKWQEALGQAISNRSFANVSIVTLDKRDTDIPSSAKERFRAGGIGLLAFDDDGDIKTVVPVPKYNSSTRDRSFQLVRLVRDLHKKDVRSKWRLTRMS